MVRGARDLEVGYTPSAMRDSTPGLATAIASPGGRTFAFRLAGVLVVVAFAIGWVGGRLHLGSQWREPRIQVGGVTVVRPMPLAKTRTIVSGSPLAVQVAAVGRDESTVSLHVVFENRTSCKVVGYSGLAYGFDAFGEPAPITATGALFTRLEATALSIEPGAKFLHESPLDPRVDRASIVVAELDQITCDGGKVVWTRK